MRRARFVLPALALCLSAVAHAETTHLKVQKAITATDAYGQESVQVTLAPESVKALAAFTRERVGQRIEVRAGDTLLTTATLQSPIDGPSLSLAPGTLGFDGVSAPEMARRLSADGTLTIAEAKDEPPRRNRSSVFQR